MALAAATAPRAAWAKSSVLIIVEEDLPRTVERALTRCRLVFAVMRNCEDTLDRVEVVSAPKQAVVCVFVEHRAAPWCVCEILGKSSGVRSSSL